MLDLEYIDSEDLRSEDIAPLVGELIAKFAWRSVVLMGTSIPATMGSVREGTVGCIPRHEWRLWCALASIFETELSYGDYCVQHPKPPQEQGGPGMRANIRYTVDDRVLVARGRGPVVFRGNSEYTNLCQKIVVNEGFAGESYSWGDETIAKCARGERDPGAQAMWRGAGTSHHITFVTKQLAQLPHTA